MISFRKITHTHARERRRDNPLLAHTFLRKKGREKMKQKERKRKKKMNSKKRYNFCLNRIIYFTHVIFD